MSFFSVASCQRQLCKKCCPPMKVRSAVASANRVVKANEEELARAAPANSRANITKNEKKVVTKYGRCAERTADNFSAVRSRSQHNALHIRLHLRRVAPAVCGIKAHTEPASGKTVMYDTKNEKYLHCFFLSFILFHPQTCS